MGVCCVTRKENKDDSDAKQKDAYKPEKMIYLNTDNITNNENNEENDKSNEEDLQREEEIVAALLNSGETHPKQSKSLDFGGVPMDSSVTIKKKALSVEFFKCL